MKKWLLLSIVLIINIVFCQDLTKEQEIYYNNNKIIIETNRKIKGLGTSFGTHVGISVGSYKEDINYYIYKGYDEITVEELAINFGDNNKYQEIVSYKNKSKFHKKYAMVGFALSIASLSIQSREVVHPKYFDVYWSNVPATFGIPISIYHLLRSSSSKKNKDYIILNQALDMAELYNKRLLKEIKAN